MLIPRRAIHRGPTALSRVPAILALSTALLLIACGGGGSGGSTPAPTPTPTPTPSTVGDWTWVSGGSAAKGWGVYGTLGIAAASNVPGARGGSVGGIDSSGDLWLFGGDGADSVGDVSLLNDLWEFKQSSKEWVWVSGSNLINASGIYGTQGVASASNVPGARDGSVGGIDNIGNLWLFGGGCYTGYLNDLWEFNPTTKKWTWISGYSVASWNGGNGVYGKQGTASASNVPGVRTAAVSWIDSSGNFWLFGGDGADSTANIGFLNDLWEFNPTSKEWTWVSGSDTYEASGVYGTQGVASASNVPGARDSSTSWIDSDGNLWLFGGTGYDSTGIGTG